CFKTPWSETALENGFKVLGVKTTGFETLSAITDDFSVCKVILFFTDKEKLSLFLDHYKDKYEMRIGKGGLYVDFNQKGITKGCGVEEIIKYYNADVADTFAFGDGENDVEMLSAVNVSVAMGRHSPLLDNISKFVCDTVANDGIVNSLKKFKLI
ncbi:MAG: HAD hydrolase family protein, partial [Oscillospiraceae bacterium]